MICLELSTMIKFARFRCLLKKQKNMVDGSVSFKLHTFLSTFLHHVYIACRL